MTGKPFGLATAGRRTKVICILRPNQEKIATDSLFIERLLV